eukprot:5337487-Prymnesium_polylepis.1
MHPVIPCTCSGTGHSPSSGFPKSHATAVWATCVRGRPPDRRRSAPRRRAPNDYEARRGAAPRAWLGRARGRADQLALRPRPLLGTAGCPLDRLAARAAAAAARRRCRRACGGQ